VRGPFELVLLGVGRDVVAELPVGAQVGGQRVGSFDDAVIGLSGAALEGEGDEEEEGDKARLCHWHLELEKNASSAESVGVFGLG